MKKTIVKIGFAVLFATMIATYGFQVHKSNAPTAVGQSYNILKANVSKGVTVSGSTTKILDASSGRTYAVIVNDGTVPVYLSVDGNPAVAHAGIRLNPSGGSYEINSLNQFVSQLNAITATSTALVTVTAAQ